MKGSTTGWKSGEGSGDRIGSSRISLAQEEDTGVEVGQEEDCFEMKSRNFFSRSSFVSTAIFVFMSCVVGIVLSQWLRMKSWSSSWMSLLDTRDWTTAKKSCKALD